MTLASMRWTLLLGAAIGLFAVVGCDDDAENLSTAPATSLQNDGFTVIASATFTRDRGVFTGDLVAVVRDHRGHFMEDLFLTINGITGTQRCDGAFEVEDLRFEPGQHLELLVLTTLGAEILRVAMPGEVVITTVRDGDEYGVNEDIPVSWKRIQGAERVLVDLGGYYRTELPPESVRHIIPGSETSEQLRLKQRLVVVGESGTGPRIPDFAPRNWSGPSRFWVRCQETVDITIG